MPTARVTLLQEMALTSNYPETRINALLVMARLEPAVAFENATAMLNDANPLIRAAAFRVIGASSNATVHDTLMRGVEDPDEYVRTVAAAALLEKAQVPGGRPAARPAGRQNTRPAGRR